MRWLYHAQLAQPGGDGPLAPSSLGGEGFVHCSFRDVVVESATRYLPDASNVDIFQIDPRRLEARIVVADTPRGPMPHVHGPIPRDAIVSVTPKSAFDPAAMPDLVRGTRFAFVAFEGMTLLDLVGVYDPISRISTMGFDATSTCEIIGGHKGRVWAHSGAELMADRARPPLTDFDVVVVPGGASTIVLQQDPTFIDWLRRYPHNRLLASVCTGALLLGAAGRLQGKRATTHHDSWDKLAAFGAMLVRDRVVDEGQIVTAGGVTSGIDLGLHLVARLEGLEAAQRIAERMEVVPG